MGRKQTQIIEPIDASFEDVARAMVTVPSKKVIEPIPATLDQLTKAVLKPAPKKEKKPRGKKRS